jgi:hypothetical protein
MHHILRIASATALIISLVGCLGPKPVTNPEQYRTAIVIAAVPETLIYSYIGLTVFQNRKEVVSTDWGLSARALEHLAQAASKRYQVMSVAVDPASFEGLQSGADVAKDGSYTVFSEAVRRAVGAQSADLIILMDAASMQKPGDRNPESPRLGAVLGERFLGQDAGTRVGVTANFRAFDGKTFQQITTTGVATRLPFPHRTRGEPYASLPTDVKNDIRTAVWASLPETVNLGLKQLGLN